MNEQLPPEAPSPEVDPAQWGAVVFMALALLGTAALCGLPKELPVWKFTFTAVAMSYSTAIYFAWRAKL